MEIEIQIVAEKIVVPEQQQAPDGAVGAWVEFTGRVRGQEGGQNIAGLVYEAYQPMAEQEMRRLLRELAAAHPCLRACVIHRIGAVPVGEAAIYLGVAGAHRAEAFALAMAFMDRLKQDVPIWKSGVLPC